MQAGRGVRTLLRENPNVQRILGWVDAKPQPPGKQYQADVCLLYSHRIW